MKTRSLLSVCLGVAFAAGVSAQTTPRDTVVVEFPYEVSVENKTLEPGRYTIQEQRSDTGANVLRFSNEKGEFQFAVNALDAYKPAPEETQVVLQKAGNKYYLDRIWIEGKRYGYEFRLPDEVRAMWRDRRQPVTLSAEYRGEGGSGERRAADAASTTKPQFEQRRQPGEMSDEARSRMIRQVRHELVTLPDYSVFDWITFKVDGDTVTLDGFVTRPTLKDQAARVLKDIEYVGNVRNNIQVLPTSPNDDRIRLAVYQAVYGQTALNRYAMQAMPPIHIIVENGNVTLKGVVASEADKNIANIQARGVSGVFSVNNDLMVAEGA